MNTTGNVSGIEAAADATAAPRSVGRRRFAAGMLGGGLATMMAGAANAQPRIQTPAGGGGSRSDVVIEGVNADAMAYQAMREAGYTDVEVKQSDKGEPYMVGLSGATKVYAQFSECESASCSFAFMRVFLGKQAEVDLNFINAWNMTYLTTKLYSNAAANWCFNWRSGLPASHRNT